MMRARGFTLIELLITVAIIAILAAIALPNFLEAQTRAKVSRAVNDLRVIESALIIYTMDHNAPPPSSGVGPHHNPVRFANPVSRRLISLTTPSAYVVSIPIDPFVPRESAMVMDSLNTENPYDTYDYVDVPDQLGHGSEISSGGRWRIMSSGPDLIFAAGGLSPMYLSVNMKGVDYDPTNGTLSVGEIVRVSGQMAATGNGGSPDDLNNPMRPGILRVPTYREQW